MTTPPPQIDPLGSRPDLCIAIAKFLSNFNAFEAFMYTAFADMIGDDGAKTEAILSRVDSISHKMAVVFDMAAILENESNTAKAFVAVKDDIKAATSYRNLLAHSIWINGDKGELQMATNAFRVGRGAAKLVPLEMKDLKLHTRRIREAVETLNLAGSKLVLRRFKGAP